MAGDSAADRSPPNSATGLAHRLVRTLSGRANSNTTAQSSAPTQASGTMPTTVPEAEVESAADVPPSSGSNASPGSKQRGLFTGVIDRFRDLGLAFGMSSAVGGSKDQVLGSPTGTAVAGEATPPPDRNSGHAESSRSEVAQSAADSGTDTTEPMTLAEKIRSMIDSLPLPTHPRSPTSKQPKPPARDSSGKPIPPPDATHIKDSKLIAMLSSPTIMNGGRPGDRQRRISVFSVLDSLGSSRQDDGNDVDDGENDNERDGGRSDDEDSLFHDTSGIMMYSPLIPSSDSLVEIAESGIVSPAVNEGENPSSEAAQLAGWMGMWPFSALSTGVVQTSAAPGPAMSGNLNPGMASPTSSITTLPMSPPGSPRSIRSRAQAQRVWVPSTTKISFQAMWWGYKIYLPPPVMDILDDKQIEATKRAALITTALTWFFSHIPLSALPLAVRPPLLLLQTIVPYLGYIGTFISWSWGTIKSYDMGHGVILTATWLLPIALIPGTWDERDFPPPSPPQQAPTPLPPSSDPSQPPNSPQPTTPTPVPPPSSPPSTPPVSSPPTTPPAQPPSVPPSSPPVSPPAPPSAPPTSPPAQLPIQQPIGTSASAYPSPASTSPGLGNAPSPPVLSPLNLWSPAQQASEPLPSWVQPPPPPSPPKIPLPDIEEDEAPVSPSPRFRLGVLQRGKSKDGDRKDKDKERKKDKTKMKFKAIVSSPFSSSSKKGLEA